MKKLFMILIVLVFAFSAEALTCRNNIVNTGDGKYYLLSKCGRPVFKDVIIYKGRVTEIWVYNAKQLGQGTFDYQIYLVDDKIVEINHISTH